MSVAIPKAQLPFNTELVHSVHVPLDVVPNNHPYPDIDHIEKSDKIIVSPYTEDAHLLRLHTVDKQSQLLALALTQMEVLRPDYATSPYIDTFNWPEVVRELKQLVDVSSIEWRSRRYFVVAFRSKMPSTTNCGDLHALDKAAHAEATASGGFLKYWFGTPDKDGRNLATCIWCSQEHARLGGVGPAHRRAAGSARHAYTEWSIERIAFELGDGLQEWNFVPWTDGK